MKLIQYYQFLTLNHFIILKDAISHKDQSLIVSLEKDEKSVEPRLKLI